jgi:hypothetical protein
MDVSSFPVWVLEIEAGIEKPTLSNVWQWVDVYLS